MTNSRRKGARGELEVAAILRTYGYKARRGQQFRGGDDAPDVVHNVPGVHIEVKYTEHFRLYQALQQAQDDCGDLVPVVVHRRKHKPWVVILTLKNYLGGLPPAVTTVADPVSLVVPDPTERG